MVAISNTIPSSFVLAHYFDVESMSLVPDFIYDQEFSCQHCDNGKVEAINQYHQDVLIDCPHCKGEGLFKPKPRFNMPAIYLTVYKRLEEQGKLTIWEHKHYDSLRAA